jgi:glycosyltransferase involved in cell wall biosynthesis
LVRPIQPGSQPGDTGGVHVCLVTPYPLTDSAVLGGVEAASLRLAHALVSDHPVTVSVVAPADTTSREQRGPITIHWVASKPAFLPGILRYWSSERRALLKKVKELRPDVVHVQAIAGWGLGCRLPRLFQMHGVPEDAVMHTERKSRLLSRWVHIVVEGVGRRSFPMVAVVGEHMKERFRSQFRGEVFLAENTVPDSYFVLERAPVQGRVLFGGVVSNRKNVLGLLHAFRELVEVRPEAVLRIAGETHSFATYAEQCRAFVREHGLDKNVEFLGSVSIDRMREELREAQVLVLPSFNESAPIIICEAMAAGVPVITSRRDGMVSMIDEGRTGYLVEPEDTAAMVRHLVELVSDDDRNRQMGNAARHEASQRFSPGALASLMMTKYSSLASGGVAR